MSQPFIRRNRVNEKTATAIAVVSGLIAVTAGAAPTGSDLVDDLLTAVVVAVVTWAGASAPWWALAAFAGVSAAIALDPVAAAVGGVAFAGGLFVGIRRRDLGELRAVVAGVGANVLLWSELHSPFGVSAAIGITVAATLLVLGLHRRRSAVRKLGWRGLIVVGALAAVALGGFVIAASAARTNLSSGNRLAQQGIRALNEGDFERAVERFEAASDALTRAERALGRPWAQPARFIPGIAQNRVAAAGLSAAASEAAANAALALSEVDSASLSVNAGQIDLAAVAATADPLTRAQSTLDALRQAVDDARSPWLVAPVQSRLDEIEDDLDKNEVQLQNAINAVELAPQMLGSDGPRHYLLLFTTPAEARGLGGFPRYFAEVVADEGRIGAARFGRMDELEAFVGDNGASCAGCPADFVERYGRFGFTSGPDGGVSRRAWSNVTMSAHFPHVAEVASILYPQSGGQPVDGAAVMDPYVIQQLMAYTGPVQIPELGTTLDHRNAADFILRDQYLVPTRDERIDALDYIAERLVTALLTRSLPTPPVVARDLGPLVEERRLLFWSSDPDEAELLQRVGLLGELPPLVDGSGFAVTVTNAAANKIDAYLVTTTEATLTDEPNGHGKVLDATVRLENTAPASGLPAYVIGNAGGLPEGSSLLLVSLYGPSTIRSVTLNGEPFDVDVLVSLAEAGWQATEVYVDIPAGETAELRVTYSVPDHSTEIASWRQPLAVLPPS